MKRIRFHYYFLSIVSLISLICIGFSSWSLVQGLPTSATGTLTASPVYSVEDYVTFDTTKGTNGIECFEYDQNGFVVDGVNTNIASLTVYYILDVANAKKDYGNTATLNLSLYLRGVSATGATIAFNFGSPLTLSESSCEGVTKSGSHSATTTNAVVNATVNLSGLSGKHAFSVTYTFINETYNNETLFNLLTNMSTYQPAAVFYAHARIEKA